MKAFIISATAILGAQAMSLGVAKRQTTVCTGLYGTQQCCATDVLGIADLDCATPPETPTNAADFTEICSAIGQRARCCVLPILGQDVLCQDPPAS